MNNDTLDRHNNLYSIYGIIDDLILEYDATSIEDFRFSGETIDCFFKLQEDITQLDYKLNILSQLLSGGISENTFIDIMYDIETRDD